MDLLKGKKTKENKKEDGNLSSSLTEDVKRHFISLIISCSDQEPIRPLRVKNILGFNSVWLLCL